MVRLFTIKPITPNFEFNVFGNLFNFEIMFDVPVVETIVSGNTTPRQSTWGRC